MSWTPLQKKIFVLVVSLFSLVYAFTLVSIYSAAHNQAERDFQTRLEVGRNVFLNELSVAKTNFTSNVQTIAKDWALRSGVGKDVDTESIVSIIANHSNRIDANAALVFDNDLKQVALYAQEKGLAVQSLQQGLTQQDKGTAWLSLLNDDVYLVAATPIMAPKQIGWLVMARKLDTAFLERVKRLVSLDMNLLVISDTKRVNPLSTLGSEQRGQFWLNMAMSIAVPTDQSKVENISMMRMDQEELIVLPFELSRFEGDRFILVMQDSFSDSLKSLNTFLLELVPFFVVGVLLAIIGSYYIARSITRPVGKLLEAVKHITSGHYTQHIRISEKSELGELASEFGSMQTAIMDRESKIKDQAEQIKQANRDKFDLALANKQKQMAEEATQAKSRFLANVSHEIRTPLNALIGYSEMLQDDSANHEQKNKATQAINNSGKHLLSIVNDVLDVSKIEASKMALENIGVNLVELMEEVQSQMQGLAQEKGIRFELYVHYPIPAVFTSDPTRLRQILLNLCHNAVKFTDQGEVALSLYFNQLGRQLQFDVRDSGVGMSTEQQNNLFGAFAQADQTTSRKFGGTGLGLYICKELAELLGGSISVESQPGTGSTFSVSLPWQAKTDAELLYSSSTDLAQNNVTTHGQQTIPELNANILCADDNQDNRTLLAYLLEKTGSTLTLVENGKLAIEAAAKNEFDLILMDMQMPEVDGLAATSEIKRQGFSRPIVMLTANVDESSKAQVKACGADGHIGKPFDTQSFYASIQKYLDENVSQKLH